MVNGMGDLVAQIRARYADQIEQARALGLVAGPPPFDPIAWRVEQAGRVLDAKVPSLYRHTTVERDEINRWVAGLVADAMNTPSLVLMGTVGTGKTGNAYAAIAAAALGYARSGRGLRWTAVTHPEFNAAIRPGAVSGDPASAIAGWQEADLLLLDDLTAARLTDWSDEALMRVIDHRVVHQKPMIITWNVEKQDLDAAVGERIASRLRNTVRIGFTGPDRRGGAA